MKTEKFTKQSPISSEESQKMENNNNYSKPEGFQADEKAKREEREREIIPIENSPFALFRENKNEEFYIILGNNIVTEKTFKYKTDAIKYVEGKPYELITAMTIIITKNLKIE